VATKSIVTRVSSKRTASPDALAPVCRAANTSAEVIVADALSAALSAAERDSLVVVTGSLYLVGEAMEMLGLSASANERALNEWTGKRS
jgi:folylpolyglutamate synthase/dihydropteroate synthase